MSVKGVIPGWYCPFKVPAAGQGTLQPLVFLAGLDTVNNTVHRGIWEMLNLKNMTKDFQPTYVSVPIEFKFPPKKPKVDNIENYIPHGILREKWCQKHTIEIPSAVVAFFDMNWTDPMWTERKAECAKLVKELKNDLLPHGAQVLVMLIKTSGAADDHFSTDRASALCAEADIPPKFLFVLSHTHTERIQACIQRLEAGMRELSHLYYTARVRRVKNWKDRATQAPLFVRYFFKMAFFQEIRRDYSVALTHYQGASDILLSIKVSDANVQELKVVASIITYRMCRLHLLRMDGKEAKAQFDKHIRSFYNLEGNPELMFEHIAWLEQQYRNFGDLLKQYFRVGVSNIPDPVGYFIQAAKYAERRQQFYIDRISKSELNFPEELRDYNDEINLKFLGQRPWRLDSFNPDAAYSIEDECAVKALRFFESMTFHSERIISHLGVASDFCKDIQRTRTRAQLMSMMGMEFYNAKEYAKCIMLMSHVIRELGHEKWTKMISSVADCGLQAAYFIADVAAFLTFLVVLLKLDANTDAESGDKRQCLNNQLTAVLNCEIPRLDENLNADQELGWKNNLSQPQTSYVGVHQGCVISANIYFKESNVHLGHSAIVCFELKNNNSIPMYVRKCGIVTTILEYNTYVSTDLCLQPGETVTVDLTFKPLARDVTKIVQIQVAHIDVGKGDKSVLLHYSQFPGSNIYLWNEWQSELSVIKINAAKPMLKSRFIHQEPVLVNEWYPITVEWTNTDDVEYHRIYLAFLLGASDTQFVSLTTDPVGKNEMGVLTYTSVVEKLGIGSSFRTNLYVKTTNHDEAELKFVIKAKYIDGNAQTMTVEQLEILKVSQPFQVDQVIENLHGDKLHHVTSEEDFFIHFKIKNVSKSNLKLKSCVLNTSGMKVRDSGCQAENVTLNENNKISLSYLIRLDDTTVPTFGSLDLLWNRYADTSTLWTLASVPLTSLTVGPKPHLHIEADVSSLGGGKLKKPMLVSYTIKNLTSKVHDLSISLEANDSFMNAGPKKINVKLQGLDYADFSFILFPLITGCVSTPKLLVEQTSGTVVQGIQESMVVSNDIPKTMFITRGEDNEKNSM